jgi:hypothetical protein
VWNLPDLTAGGSAWIRVSGAYSDTLATGTPLLLAAEVNTQTPEASTANNRAWLELGAWLRMYLPMVGWMSGN